MAQTRYVTLRVWLDGPAAPDALDEASLPNLATLDLGNGAKVSRPILLGEAQTALDIVADVVGLALAARELGRWLYGLTRKDGVVIERIGRTTVRHVTADGITEVVQEEIEREVKASADRSER